MQPVSSRGTEAALAVAVATDAVADAAAERPLRRSRFASLPEAQQSPRQSDSDSTAPRPGMRALRHSPPPAPLALPRASAFGTSPEACR